MLHTDPTSNALPIVKLQEHEIDEAADVLREAFQSDTLMRWIFGTPEHYDKASKAVFRTWITYCFLYGAVYRSSDFGSVAILKSPEPHASTWLNVINTYWKLYKAGMIFSMHAALGAEAFDRLMQFHERSTQEARNAMGGKNYWYLWMLGTKKSLQGQGYGAMMLAEIDKLLDAHTACYLEATSDAHDTARKTSVNLYARNGYKQLMLFNIRNSNVNIHGMEKNLHDTAETANNRSPLHGKN